MDARDLLDGTPPPPKRPRNDPPSSLDSAESDRISNLPEGVLHHVMSLLPAHEAVRTCVLARPWRHLWRSAPGLVVTNGRGMPQRRSVQPLRRPPPPLESCEFSFCEFDCDFDGFLAGSAPLLGHWIRRALRHRTKLLRLYVDQFDGEDYYLPDLPLVSQHLTALELCGVFTNDSVLDFTACPALADLRMTGSCHTRANRVSSPSLKRLTVSDCFFYAEDRTRLSLPALVSLEIVRPLGRVPLLERMPSLGAATVALDDECCDLCSDRVGRVDACGNPTCQGCYYSYDPVDDRNDCVLLKGLCEATHLELTADPDVFVFMRDLKWCPTFNKLKTLVLGEWCLAANLDALILFLQHVPVLEKLTLQLPKERKNSMGAERSNSNPLLEQSVSCGLLKVVKIKCQEVDGMVLQILKILNASGVPLANINIQCVNGRSRHSRFSFVCTELSSE